MKTIQPKINNFQFSAVNHFDISKLIGTILCLAIAELFIIASAIFGGGK